MSGRLELVTDDNLDRIARRFAGGGGGGNNDEMDPRIAKLQEFAETTRDRLARIETKLDDFGSRFATREDLHREIGAQTWRIIGAMITLGTLLSGIVFYVARNVR